MLRIGQKDSILLLYHKAVLRSLIVIHQMVFFPNGGSIGTATVVSATLPVAQVGRQMHSNKKAYYAKPKELFLLFFLLCSSFYISLPSCFIFRQNVHTYTQSTQDEQHMPTCTVKSLLLLEFKITNFKHDTSLR